MAAPPNGSQSPSTALKNTVQVFPEASSGGSMVLAVFIGGMADAFPAWGLAIKQRDLQLRAFWPTEPTLAGAFYSIVARNSAFRWKIKGPEATAKQVERLLWTACFGKGWDYFITKITLDLLSQDNGAFAEIIREFNSPTAPVMGINHLDADRCTRTGDPLFPVIYEDRDNVRHKMAWYSIVTLEDMPSPIERMNDLQYCALTRILRAAQIIRDMGVYKHEKISGRFSKSIHLVGGVSNQAIKDARAISNAEADNMGLTRYKDPIILAGLDPNATVSHEEIELAGIPDGFDEDTTLRWYIAQIANGVGTDYQEFAPLPAGNLGTSRQSDILHQKARGKGPARFMSMIWYMINYRGICPQTCEFIYEEQDVAASTEMAELKKTRAETRAARISSKEITPEMARKEAIAVGDLDPDLEKLAPDTPEQRGEVPEAQLTEPRSEPLPKKAVSTPKNGASK